MMDIDVKFLEENGFTQDEKRKHEWGRKLHTYTMAGLTVHMLEDDDGWILSLSQGYDVVTIVTKRYTKQSELEMFFTALGVEF